MGGGTDRNGVIDDFDLLIWQNNFGSGPGASPTPEPSALVLLAFAGLALLPFARRRCG